MGCQLTECVWPSCHKGEFMWVSDSQDPTLVEGLGHCLLPAVMWNHCCNTQRKLFSAVSFLSQPEAMGPPEFFHYLDVNR